MQLLGTDVGSDPGFLMPKPHPPHCPHQLCLLPLAPGPCLGGGGGGVERAIQAAHAHVPQTRPFGALPVWRGAGRKESVLETHKSASFEND